MSVSKDMTLVVAVCSEVRQGLSLEQTQRGTFFPAYSEGGGKASGPLDLDLDLDRDLDLDLDLDSGTRPTVSPHTVTPTRLIIHNTGLGS